MIYWIILSIVVTCIYVYDINNTKKFKTLFYYLILLLSILVSGLAYRLGTDSIRYQYEFEHQIVKIGDISCDYLLSFRAQPGYVILCTICKTICESFYFFKIIYALLINVVIFRTIKMHTNYLFSGILLYLVVLFPYFNFEIFRESLAICVFLLSLPFFYNKEWMRYYLMMFFALLFHLSALVLIFLPLISKFNINKRSICFVFIVTILVFLLSDKFLSIANTLLSYSALLQDNYLSYLNNDNYANSIFSISRVFNYFFNIWLPLIMIYIFNKKGAKGIHYSIIIVFILVYSLTQCIPILYRFNNYFKLFMLLFNINIIYFVSRYFLQKRVCYVFLLTIYLLFSSRSYLSKIDETGVSSYSRYYPYSSIIDKKTDSQRELLFIY